jgi:hypothetical protein
MITSQNRFDDNYYTSISTVIQAPSSTSSSTSSLSNLNSPIATTQDNIISASNSPKLISTLANMNNSASQQQQQQLNSNQNDLQIKRDKDAILK